MRIWVAVVALAFVVACNKTDAATDAYVNEKMPVALARLEDGRQILRSTSGGLPDEAGAAKLVHAAKTLHTAATLMKNITPPPAFKAAHESYSDVSEMLATNIDAMVKAATEHDDPAFTRTYTAALETMGVFPATDRLWDQLLKEAHVTQKKLPAPPAD